MRHNEYEKRRRALEKQYEEDLELIRTAHHAKLRALEMLWLASTVSPVGGDPRREEQEDEKPLLGETQRPGETRETGEPQSSSEAQVPVEPQVETPGPREQQEKVRLALPGGLKQAIRDVLPQLPEVFDRQELEEALGYEPARSTLVRILQKMWADKELAIEQYSQGRRATRYRKVAPR
jgi:hypothetical protein